MKHLLINSLELIRFALRLATRPQFYDPRHCNFYSDLWALCSMTTIILSLKP